MTTPRFRLSLILTLSLASLSFSTSVGAQTGDSDDSSWDEGSNDSEGYNDSDGGLIHQTDYSDENPTPPGGPDGEELDGTMSDGSLEVAHDAGVGSPLAYARQTVVEVGGTIALLNFSRTTDFRFAPSIGYFLVDGLELTLFADMNIQHIGGSSCDAGDVGCVPEDGSTDVRFALILEPSYHIAFSDAFYVFGAVGLGVQFARDPKADFIVRPKVGVDLLVGRSAILKPALFVDVGVNDGYAGFGLEASFTAMW